MATTFEKPTYKPQRFMLSGRIILTITVVLAVILLTSALLDVFGARREMIHVLTQQAEALIASIEAGSGKAIEAYDLVEDLTAERLLSAARLLEEMDYGGILTESILGETAENNNIFRINVFDAKGEKIMAAFYGSGMRTLKRAPDDLMAAIQLEDNDELVMGFRRSQFAQGQRFAVAKRRRKGGVIVLNIDAAAMLELRKSIGLGKLLQDISASQGIRYIVIQDSTRIIVATANVDSMSTMHSDPFLSKALQKKEPSTRFVDFQNEKAFEVIQTIHPESGGIIRLGLVTQHIEEAQRAAVLRVVLSSLLLLVFGGIGSSLLISGQNYKTLKGAYDRIETYTGSILANMTDAVIAVNNSGAITLANAAAERLFAVTSLHVRGKQCAAEISAICPFLKEGLETGRNKIYDEENIQTSRGARIADINVNVAKSPNNELLAVFAVVKDITEEKRLEENLNRKDRITAMGHLASGVAHEIRNPLNAIGMIAQRLKAEFEPKDDIDEFKQLASTVVSETRRINEIIQQFLEFTRPGELNKQAVNIKELLEHTALLLSSDAASRGIIISRDCRVVPEINADADKLKQVFLNLAQNAIAACSTGDSIHISCTPSEDAIIIEIKDTGHGMSQSSLNKIFNLYYTTRESGSGIGLSIVQQIISQHDGVIDVRSSENQGATFTITLPQK